MIRRQLLSKKFQGRFSTLRPEFHTFPACYIKAFSRSCRIIMVRRAIAICLLVSPFLLPQVSQKTYVAKGRTIRYTVVAFTPPTRIEPDNGPLNQDNAINCVRLYWSRLKALDIEGAAQLYLDPQR